ncbi:MULTISPECIES: heparinase II/III family protein [Rhodobacterales]|uniref:heparinase II/III family protein n=1 Tax=Rhodobacterales TaxID=204455 RepID=UPI00237F7209|nr:heparinase II/III family protein [Phaeobacter gallaeciensis]MDE4097870.1 heparinase II/III family protein [Phaeobacter gallaeciensis]MDE4106871.1 heparinase II/III family protein [Phaeobacter gallaeciensis]MDE4111325.1 heparinase II/III family protein [Phaeobacter gallaeciensis]MDE4115605.1 heparinase II/III family protein [Phaeobacter gallaeciensis]MDE4120266.1 heparinase II/III family protein [Phaeobacter gallaeciensis]
MSRYDRMAGRSTRLLNRLYAWRARKQPAATGFVSQPEPRTIGSFARGRQLVAGNLLLAGYLVESTTTGLWEVTAPDAAFDAERHGFAWLDDLAAVGDIKARVKAQNWVWGWIKAHGRGSGPGWSPDLTGRRVIRWINHAIFLLNGKERAESEAFYRSLSQQTWFLAHRWHGATPGLPRFEALAGLIYAGLALQGQEALADPAIRALSAECDRQIDAQGGLPTRNPEELLEVFTLLTWTAAALNESGRSVPAAQTAAIERIAPTLRTLRHSDGGLARFHGGGRGLEGWLDHALAASHVSARPVEGLAMGYARLSARRTSVVIDAALPPQGRASANGHASTLAFELTSGRRPLIVNCGSGETFGLEWRRAGRATPSHSTLCLEGHSSARLAPPSRGTGQEELVGGPTDVQIQLEQLSDGSRFQGGHDGYAREFGLTHARTLDLGFDGRALAGEDMLVALDEAAERRCSKALDSHGERGIGFDIRLHLHPEVDATLDLGGAAVSMALKSGEIWVFRHDGTCELKLEPGVYLEKTRLKPRASKQIVLSGRVIDYATRVRWTLSKAQETAEAVRDLNRDDPEIFD